MPEDATFAALCDETLVGFVKFNGPGRAAGREDGPAVSGLRHAASESLPDRDESQWELGLNGQPADPWQHSMYLPLQNVDTLEVDTFVTSSKTGRNAVGVLLKHYERMRKDHAGDVPLVQLRSGGFQHKDPRVGWVSTSRCSSSSGAGRPTSSPSLTRPSPAFSTMTLFRALT